jgi:hypothetical protein
MTSSAGLHLGVLMGRLLLGARDWMSAAATYGRDEP